MLFHDSVTDAQSQAGPFSYLLGGEEWIEDTVRMGDTGAVVTEEDFNERVGTRG